MAPVLAAHGLALALLALGAPSLPDAPAEAGALKTFALAAPAPASPPTIAEPAPVVAAMEAPVVPLVDVPPPLLVLAAAPPSLSAPQAQGEPGIACDLTGAVQHALEQDSAARAALAQVPRHDRSVANAIMLWGGKWSDDARLAAVRSVVLATVDAAAQNCREEPQAGPRLVAMAEARGATMLVLGSGEWRWADLAEPALPQVSFMAANFAGQKDMAARN